MSFLIAGLVTMPAESVRAALLFVSRREAPLGIVYATDAAADPRVKIVGVFPEDTHPPIIYPAGSHRGQQEPERGAAARFSGFAGGEADLRERGLHLPRTGGKRIAGFIRPSAAAHRPGA